MPFRRLLGRFTPQEIRRRREVRAYVADMRQPLKEAIEARHRWLGELSKVLEDARAGNEGAVISKAGSLGRQFAPTFRDCLRRAEQLSPPMAATACQIALVEWLRHLAAAAEALVNVADSQKLDSLPVCQEHLTEARFAAREFNEAERDLLKAHSLLKSRDS